MLARKKVSKTIRNSSANLGSEAKLWLAADSRSAAESETLGSAIRKNLKALGYAL